MAKQEKKPSLFDKIWYFIDPTERWHLARVIVILLVGALLETGGVGLIFPFVSLIDNPDQIQTNALLNSVYTFLGSPSTNVFLTYATLGLAVFFVLKNLYMTYLSYARSRFIHSYQTKIGTRLFLAYMHSPYTRHLKQNSAYLLRNLTKEQEMLAGLLFGRVLVLISESGVILFLLILLVIIEPIISLTAFAFIGLASTVFYLFIRRSLSRYGQIRQDEIGELNLHVNQGLGGFKLTKVTNREKYFVDRYQEHSESYVDAVVALSLLKDIPRYYIESVALFALLLAISVALGTGASTERIIPVLSLFAAAAFRLLPSAIRYLSSLNSVRANMPVLNRIYGDLNELEQFVEPAPEPYTPRPEPMQNSVTLEDVVFQYEDTDHPAINGISLEIHKGESIGFVGSTGAGKTTLIDIILGLLPITSGEIRVDGKSIYDDLREWQRRIGYIPQTIYLSDDTLRNNVAFGIPEDEIDDEKVERAIRSAQLEPFVAGLPEGLETKLGEHGVRISGGQRQRVGIARALYHDPEILIMDEATAALDNRTEADVMAALEQISDQKTLIIIAHRLSTVQNCDCLYFLKDGMIADSGTYDDLRETNSDFRHLTLALKEPS